MGQKPGQPGSALIGIEFLYATNYYQPNSNFLTNSKSQENRANLPKLEAVDGEHKDVSRVSTKYYSAALIIQTQTAGTDMPGAALIGIEFLYATIV